MGFFEGSPQSRSRTRSVLKALSLTFLLTNRSNDPALALHFNPKSAEVLKTYRISSKGQTMRNLLGSRNNVETSKHVLFLVKAKIYDIMRLKVNSTRT